MKFTFLFLILATLHLSAHSADYPRPLAYVDKKKPPPDFSVLPKALLSNELPVDPFCVGRVLMQKKGTEQPLNECAGEAKHVQKYWMFINDLKKPSAIWAEASVEHPEEEYIRKCESFYKVVGMLGNKAVVKTRTACEDADSSILIGIVEQKNNQLVSDGVIVNWKGRSNYVQAESLKDGIFRFSVQSDTEDLLDTLLNYSPENKKNPLKPDYLNNHEFLGFIDFKLDLNKNVYPFKPEVESVHFKSRSSLGYKETRTINCISTTREKFYKELHSSIVPVEKFSDFRAEVDKCVGPRKPKPKEENKSDPDRPNYI
jgi:hypothetical protein